MHFKKTLSLLAFALCVVGASGCGKQGGEAKPASDQKGGAVLAEVNGTTITENEFYKELETLPPYLKPMTETPEGKKEMLDTMVVRELILQQAAKDGVDKSPQVAAKLEDLKKRVVVEAYLKKKVEESANLSDADLQDYYKKNQDKFKTGDQIHASHILVKTEPEAQKILKELKGGADFATLAREKSTCPSSKQGGDLGFFAKGRMDPVFEQAAFALKPGELSQVVETRFGYHVIKLVERKKSEEITLAAARQKIEDFIKAQKTDSAVEVFVGAARGKAKIELL